MLDIYDVLLIGGVFCGFITSILLFTQGRFQLHANRLLSLVIFALSWYAFLYLLIKTDWLRHVPGIYRVGSPLYYLIGPCAYLYVRSIIRDESRFRKWDWLHFLPAILHFIELIPFYLADAETKKQVVEAITRKFNNSYQKASGLIPALWHFAFRPFHALIYLVFQWILLFRALNRRNNYNILSPAFSKIKGWLFVFTALVTLIVLGMIVQAFLGIINANSTVSIVSSGLSTHIVLTFVFFLLSTYLLFKPELLYGTLKTTIPKPVPPIPVSPAPGQLTEDIPEQFAKEETRPVRRETLLDEELVILYAKKIEEHLLTRQSFKKQGLTSSQLAVELAMPVHHLSYVLNQHYKQRFTDFINQCRVDYIRRLFKGEEWRKMKLESLGAEAGFSSRSTFFSAFKKITGLTPAEYARQTETVPD
jgi:AraC-like DNA-binding protein